MTKAAAIYQFWSSFGLEAYEENAIYSMLEKPQFPYVTYELNTDSFGNNDIALSASLWYHSHNWVNANAKAEEISASIGNGGKIIPCDGGYIWIKRRSPFAQSMGDDSDDKIKRKLLSISVEFWTEN